MVLPAARNDWVKEPSKIQKIPFAGQPGLRVPLPINKHPIDFFYLIADQSYFDFIINSTNLHVEYASKNATTLGEHAKVKTWTALTREEFTIYLGLVYHMGSIQLPKIRDYWRTDNLYNLPCFRNAMTKHRFSSIMSCLYFPGDISPDKRLYKIHLQLQFFNSKMNAIYSPEKNVAIHESMLLWRERMSYRPPVNNKRQTCGIKLAILTESRGTILSADVTCEPVNASEKEKETRIKNIVSRLMQGKLNRGFSVYLDQVYNSYSLSKTLLLNKTYCTGPLRPTLKSNPVEVLTAKLKPGEIVSRYRDFICVGKWRTKGELLYLTTEHDNVYEEIENKRGQKKMRPKPVTEYSKNRLVFDVQDQLLSYYSSHRKTKWYNKMGVHILEIMLFNSFVLYNNFTVKKLALSDFRDAVVSALLAKVLEK